MTFKVFQNNTALTVEDLNDVLMEQAVITFNDASERDNAIPAPNPGMHCHLLSTKTTYYYHATEGWVGLLPATTGGNKYTSTLFVPTGGTAGALAPGQLVFSEANGKLFVIGPNNWYHEIANTQDSIRRHGQWIRTTNFTTATTGDTNVPKTGWSSSSSANVGTAIDPADTVAWGLPTAGLWQVTFNVRGSSTGTGERYAAIVNAKNHSIRYAAENNIGAGTFTMNMTAMIDITQPTDIHLAMFTSAGAITVGTSFEETRLSIYRLTA